MKDYKKILEFNGFEEISLGASGIGYGKILEKRPRILGSCEPIESHQIFLDKIKWWSSPIIFVRNQSPFFVLTESFFCLESNEIPISLLELRDYFDYGLVKALKERFQKWSFMVGPKWIYLYSTENIKLQLGNNAIHLTSPLIGSSLNIYSDDLENLININVMMKDFIECKVPLPMMWSYPAGITVGIKDNIYDAFEKQWYRVLLKGDYKGAISIADFALNNSDKNKFAEHDFQGNIKEVDVRRAELTLVIEAEAQKFRRQRKLSRLNIAFG